MDIQISYACADTQTELLHLRAVIEDSVYIRGSQTLIDPAEYGPAVFATEIPFENLSDFNPYATDLIAQVDGVDLEACDWRQVDTSDE
jgi:hypothetical protein